jgi:exodeoxyribonuclease V alpha subunit
LSKDIKGEECISGDVERVAFHNPENRFTVLKVKIRSKREAVTVIGKISLVSAGEFIQAKGLWVNDKEHGLQFKASFLKTTTPNTLEGIEKYLGSGLIKWIEVHYAQKLISISQKLIAIYKDAVFAIIKNSPDRLIEVPAIGKTRAQPKNYSKQRVVREIMIFLHSHGVSTARASRIYSTYGDEAIKIINENPYKLAKDIIGIGFITADAIACKLGIAKDSSIRAEAGISCALIMALSDGHCGLPKEKLIMESMKLLALEKAIVEEAIANVLKAGEVITDTINKEEIIFLAAYYQYEVTIANKLKDLLISPLAFPEIDIVKAIPWVENKLSITLATSQKEAIAQAMKAKVLVITGGPGTGKTTLVKYIITILRAKDIEIKLGAPTGRAAKRLSETSAMEAQTIHRLLEYNPTCGFKYNENNLLQADLVIIDEVSMIDVQLMSLLLKAIPKQSSLIIVGDIDQLPSVGPGNVLSDVIDSNVIPVVRLKEIFRQAADSLIIINANKINQGIYPTTLDTVNKGLYELNRSDIIMKNKGVYHGSAFISHY